LLYFDGSDVPICEQAFFGVLGYFLPRNQRLVLFLAERNVVALTSR